MRGRYGIDKLNLFLVVASIVIAVIGLFVSPAAQTAKWILTGASTVLVALCVLRMMSKNFQKRQLELHIYNEVVYKIKTFFTGFSSGVRRDANERKLYKRFSCPQCGQKLRVPRGKGRVRVTCAKCGRKFEAKS